MSDRVSLVLDNPETETQKLNSLLEISQTLSSTLDLRQSLGAVLEILEGHHGVTRSMVTLFRDNTEELHIEASTGLAKTGRQARYKLGEGIIGRVVQSGKPIVVPRVSREPMFLNRAGKRKKREEEDYSFICVPIPVNRETVGALGADLRYKQDRDFDQATKFFGIVASLVAHAVKVNQLVEREKERLVQENSYLRTELQERYEFSNIVGNSNAMKEVYTRVTQVARSNATVLIRGESGTGKELIAHAIHYNSLRAHKPFVRVSCAALPETLIESELFGYEKGAFTGANAQKKGRFELAHEGTLFLDEIGELDISLQTKLLRAIQEREFERLGGTETIKVNVRLIAATNKDLEEAMSKGTFREDLYYRLNVFSIFVPPLRDRKSDALLLADHFLDKYSIEHRKNIKRISTPAIDMLTAYHWPGNVRELENVIERAVLVCDGQVIHGHHLPPTLQTAEVSGTSMNVSLDDAVAAYEKDMIQDALKSARGNRAKAARLLQTTQRIVGYKIGKYEINCDRFR